ncbi:MAG: hypothetical protein ACJ8DX_06245 [Xanthobacteraceae bacterium]
MLSRRYRHRSWAYEYRHQNDRPSMFRMLAMRWRPVAAELRNPETVDDSTSHETERKTLPVYWSPWLLIK